MYDNLKFLRGGMHSAEGRYIHITREAIHSVELILVTEGTLYMFVESRRYELKRGDVLRILPEMRHGGYRDSSGAAFIWLHITGVGEEELPEERFSAPSLERGVLLAREALHYSASESHPTECADYLARVLLSELTSEGEEECGPIYSAKKLIYARAGLPLSASEVAERLGYSEDYLSRLFKRRYGTGLKQYIDRARLECVKRELLTGEYPLSELARRLGFTEYKNFLKFFKYHEGMTPTEYINSYYQG